VKGRLASTAFKYDGLEKRKKQLNKQDMRGGGKEKGE
jgi:hypothetical protein